MALATQQDVEAELGRSLTSAEEARVQAALNRASALVRGYTRQTFEQVIDDAVTLRADGDIIRLPQRPVLSVKSVKALGFDAVPDIPIAGFYWDGLDTIDLRGVGAVINLPSWWEDTNYSTFQVTYSHGYAVVPEDIVSLVAGMVANAFLVAGVGTGVPGVQRETIGNYSYGLADGVTAAVSLSADDKELLQPYRRSAGTTMLRLR